MERFNKLAKSGYGYRMYLDDLPSATRYAGQDHFDETIPVGYVPEVNEHREDVDQVNIFNHLDITVIVHETELSNHMGTLQEGGY